MAQPAGISPHPNKPPNICASKKRLFTADSRDLCCQLLRQACYF